jgi:hypothetical protein
MSRLVQDLGNLPAIVGGLGLSIAEAQKQLNADFVQNIGRLLEMISETLGADGAEPDNDSREAIVKLLTALAPSRYQFTETTIEFCADIAERMQKQGELGIGFGKSVMLNAAFSKAFGYDYRAAARITSVLHAMPVGQDMADELLRRASSITPPELPAKTALEASLFSNVSGVYKSLMGEKSSQPALPQSGQAGAQGERKGA